MAEIYTVAVQNTPNVGATALTIQNSNVACIVSCNANTGDCFSTLQDAINNVGPGETIQLLGNTDEAIIINNSVPFTIENASGGPPLKSRA